MAEIVQTEALLAHSVSNLKRHTVWVWR